MKKIIFLVIALAAIGTGCRHDDLPSQWILESYNSDNGYVFRRDGIRYQTRCFSDTKPGETVLDAASRWKQTSGSNAVPETACFEVVRYLHKSVPLKSMPGTNLLYCSSEDSPGTSYWFLISEEK
jgi:hypothetical protein